LKIQKLLLTTVALGILVGIGGCERKPEKTRIAMVVKNLGNGFFNAAHIGADEAAKQLGNVEVIYTGQTTPSAEGQI
jgi:rhamnose transport system substrate-binding protein